MNEKGLSGLCNLGNTCFINSCFQIISHTFEINEILDNEEELNKNLNDNVDKILLLEWDELRKLLWNENCVVSPLKFINAIQNISNMKNIEIFSGYSQNDISEFFVFVIDCFHNSVKRKVKISITGKSENKKDELALKCYKMIYNNYSNDYSEFWELFYGISVTVLYGLETNQNINIIPESFLILSLPIPVSLKSKNNNISIYDCFEKYIEPEIIDGENAVFNEKTKQKENVRKYTTFWSFPKILVIELKRYYSESKKNKMLVDFPLENLDLTKYVEGYDKKSYIYDLYGVCNHSGGVLGGHYTSYIKTANNNWYHFNDTVVSKVNNPRDIITPYAYCFFYRKRK